MIVGVLTTCHTQYTWDSSICIFLFNRTTLQVFVTYLTGALYVHPLWFYKHQHDNWVHSTQNAFSLPFAAILVNCAPSGEMHYYCTPHIIKENFENFLIHRCNYILPSQVYCVWRVVKTPTIIFNNPVLSLFFFAQQSPSGPGPPHSPSFYITHSDTPQTAGLLWTSDQLVAETSDNTQHSQQTSMRPVGFEPTIPACERPQTYPLDNPATGIRTRKYWRSKVRYMTGEWIVPHLILTSRWNVYHT